MDFLAKVKQKYPEGFKFAPGDKYRGQCAWWVQQVTNCPLVGNTLQIKKDHVHAYRKHNLAFYLGEQELKKGYSVVTNDDPNAGHLFMIGDIKSDAVLAAECNVKAPLTVSYTRWVKLDPKKIKGIIKSQLYPNYRVEEEKKEIVIPDWAKPVVEQALKDKKITKIDDLFSEVANPTARAMFYNYGLATKKEGSINKMELLVIIDRLLKK